MQTPTTSTGIFLDAGAMAIGAGIGGGGAGGIAAGGRGGGGEVGPIGGEVGVRNVGPDMAVAENVGAAGFASPSGVPQRTQNRVTPVASAPQRGQILPAGAVAGSGTADATGFPQNTQNFVSSTFSFPQ